MNAVLAAARRAGPTLAALLVSYAGASSGLLAEKSPVSQDNDDAPTTPMCQKDYLESNRADVFKHTGPDTVKTGSKVHGRMQIFAGNGNPDLADEIGESACKGRSLSPGHCIFASVRLQWPT